MRLRNISKITNYQRMKYHFKMIDKKYIDAITTVAQTLETRNVDYGDPFELHEEIAKMWSVILKRTITANQVVMCMMAVKMARLSLNDQTHDDSGKDLVGYAGIGRRIAEIEKELLKHK